MVILEVTFCIAIYICLSNAAQHILKNDHAAGDSVEMQYAT